MQAEQNEIGILNKSADTECLNRTLQRLHQEEITLDLGVRPLQEMRQTEEWVEEYNYYRPSQALSFRAPAGSWKKL